MLSQALLADAAPSGCDMGCLFQFYRKPVNQREVKLSLSPWVTELVRSHAENQARVKFPVRSFQVSSPSQGHNRVVGVGVLSAAVCPTRQPGPGQGLGGAGGFPGY